MLNAKKIAKKSKKYSLCIKVVAPCHHRLTSPDSAEFFGKEKFENVSCQGFKQWENLTKIHKGKSASPRCRFILVAVHRSFHCAKGGVYTHIITRA